MIRLRWIRQVFDAPTFVGTGASIGLGISIVLLAACGGSGTPPAVAEQATLEVVASFYPLQFVVEEVGAEWVEVDNLTPPGAEPHDLEITPGDAASLEDADLIVHLAGFAPALDAGIGMLSDSRVLDVGPAARLAGAEPEDDHAEADHAEADHADDDHAEADHADDDHADDDHDHGEVDPHFWLDPTRLADVADAVATRLELLDPDHGDEFRANAAALRARLEALDAELAAGLADCASTDLVTSHAAFGYLAERYGLTQVGISGLSPGQEPSPATLAEVADFVVEHGVSTIYYETLVDPAIATTVAAETGARTAVLDPIEGLTDTGGDYFEVMRSNLTSLRAGQDCA